MRGLKRNIESYGNLIVDSNFSCERKAILCMNAVEHYKGNHINCLHAPYKSRVEEVMDLPEWAVPMTDEKSDTLRIFLNAALKY